MPQYALSSPQRDGNGAGIPRKRASKKANKYLEWQKLSTANELVESANEKLSMELRQ